MLDSEQVKELSQGLAELRELEKEIVDRVSLLSTMGLEEKLREYLERARQLAEKLGPDTFSVSVGIPWGVQVSLSWQQE